MRKTILGGLACLALSCSVHPKPEDVTRYNYMDVHNNVVYLANGIRRVERVTCSDSGRIELQINYKDANGRTKLLLTMDRSNTFLFCKEAITVVDATQEFRYVGILYDDGCDGTVDRYSEAPGSRNRFLHYRIINTDENNEINDNEFLALRREIDSRLDIDRQINVCEEIEN